MTSIFNLHKRKKNEKCLHFSFPLCLNFFSLIRRVFIHINIFSQVKRLYKDIFDLQFYL